MQKVIATIDLNAIEHNAKRFQTLCNTPLCAVVKADGYGHGAEEVVSALQGVVNCFAVALLQEAKAICVAACGRDILILTPPTCDEEILQAATYGFILTVPSLSTAKRVASVAAKYNLPIRVHLKTNTGMNRYGMNVFALGKVCKLLQRKTRVKVEGLYSHLYANRREVAEEQRQRFLQMQRVAKGYFPQIKCHLSATYGALLGKAFCFDMVRIGIGLYGYLPNADTQEAAYASLGLLPAMKVEAKLVQNRVYSYGGAGYESLQKQFSLTKGERLAVCRAGYADGFLRSGEWFGEGETLLGNLCMDCMLLKTEKRQGQTVVLMQDAAVVAKRQGTIPYEILCSVTKRAEKVYIR